MTSTAIVAQAEAQIRAHTIPGLDGLDNDAIFPNYGGLSIANIAPTFASLLGIEAGGTPLWDPLWEPYRGRVDRVVFIILDALGYLQLREALDADPGANFHRIAQAGLLVPLTSVFPSTTTAATTTFATGRAPLEHGLLGYELFLREFSRAANMILLSGRGARRSGELVDLGLKYDTFVPVPSVAQRLAVEGIPTFVMLPYNILDSGLSKLQYRGGKMVPYLSSADMWVGVRHLLTARPGPALISVYWPGVDSAAHHYGPDTEMTKAEIRNLAYSLGRELLDGLPASARRRTLLVISADHGQMRSQPQDAMELAHHPDLARRLLFAPTGEARTAYLYARQGEKAAVLDYLRQTLGQQFAAWDSDAAYASGLFGPAASAAPEARSRLGDVVLVARQTYSLQVEGVHKPPAEMPGRHGALSPAEMLVPWLAAHLEDVA
ncbi:MAG: alkaline phosphatase family protein [Anaerolineae bacterium]|nr:alkaline phosphatase family protein [Anaerolineae bacterium]